MKRLSSTEAMQKIRETHGYRYRYPDFTYTNSSSPITVECRIHGVFYPKYIDHVRGSHCRRCAATERAARKKYTATSYAKKARSVWGDAPYDYSLVIYKDSTSEVTIICSEHGPFSVVATAHLQGKRGCPSCTMEKQGKLKIRGPEDFLRQVRRVHGDVYDFSKTVFADSATKVVVTCPTHGDFEINPYNLRNGHGCLGCSGITRAESIRKGNEYFIEKAKATHGDRYLYPDGQKWLSDSKVSIVCPVHGTFTQRVGDHVEGHGCNECGFLATKEALNFETYLEKHAKPWYTYHTFTSYFEPMMVTCNEHNIDVTITGHAHAVSPNGGCPKCKNVTRLQRYLMDNIPLEMTVNDRSLIPPQEIDLYFPEKKVGIELNGVYWHHEGRGRGRSYHQDKVDAAAERGITLFHLWEDANTDQDLVLSVVKAKLGLIDQRISARKCKIREVSTPEFRDFLEYNHLQGKTSAKVKYGLYFGGKLVAAMGFLRVKGEWHLVRFASERDSIVQGGFSRLLKHFQRNFSPQKIVSFSDYGYSDGGVYRDHGFRHVNESTGPRMWYTDGSTLEDRRHFQRKNIARRRPDIPWGPEKEMASAEGFFQVFGCKTIRWELESSPV